MDDLVSGLQGAGHDLSREAILRVVAESDKKRFTLSDDGQRIRAAQGHSVEVDLGLAPSPPPDVLFHGTATRSLDRIRTEGLRPGKRRHVHLSPDEETARRVGQRHGRPVVLKVDTASMHREGHLFWMGTGQEHWAGVARQVKPPSVMPPSGIGAGGTGTCWHRVMTLPQA